MEDWTNFSDEQVFKGASEQPGSQAAYWRQTEISRRQYLQNAELLRAQLAAVEAQRAAIEAANTQSKWMFWSVMAATASAVAAFLTALVTYLVAR